MLTIDIDPALVVLRPSVNLATARRAIAAVHGEAVRNDWAVSVAVVDAAGELVAFERADSAAGVTMQVALAKARTAALLRAPSKVFEDFVNDGFPSFLSTPGVTPLQGGVPIESNGHVIGAVGVSGARGEEDAQMATLAVAAAVA